MQSGIFAGLLSTETVSEEFAEALENEAMYAEELANIDTGKIMLYALLTGVAVIVIATVLIYAGIRKNIK